jgi:hypothetical protein
MHRQAPLENSFLRLGTAGAGARTGTATVAPPGGVTKLDPKQLAERISERRHRAPRCRRLVVFVPLGDLSSSAGPPAALRGGPSSQRGSSKPAYS